MSPKKEVRTLTVLSYTALGHYLRSYVRVISSRSFNLTVTHKACSGSEQVQSDQDFGRNRSQASVTSKVNSLDQTSHSLQRVSSLRGLKYKAPVEDYVTSTSSQGATNIESCEEFIDDAIKIFHNITFNSLPWYCHQRLAEVYLQVLGESAAACRLLYRKWDEAHLYLHHVQVNRAQKHFHIVIKLIKYESISNTLNCIYFYKHFRSQ